MDTKSIDLLAQEIERASKPVSKVIRGLSILLKQEDLIPAARELVTGNMEAYTRRNKLLGELLELLMKAREAIVALLLDGHPGLPNQEVNGDVADNIEENLSALTAARGTFKLRAQTVAQTFGAEGNQHTPRDHAGDD